MFRAKYKLGKIRRVREKVEPGVQWEKVLGGPLECSLVTLVITEYTVETLERSIWGPESIRNL